MKPSQKLIIIQQERERRAREPIAQYNKGDRVHLKQIDFHKSNLRNRWLFGGNRTGKTVGGGVEAVWFATGTHPYKNIQASSGWVVSLTNEVQRDVAQKEILRWLPKRYIKDVQVRAGRKDDPENAILDFILLTNGCKIGFKSCDQGREKFQGTSQGWIWFDEEPPKEIYDECKMRVIDTRGYIWGTMTPLKGLTWVYNTVYMNDNNDPEVKYWLMEWADNPWLSPDEIAQLEATMTEDERESRQYGKFVALSGLIYKEFREDIHIIDPRDIPIQWYDKISIDPGYTNPLSCHFYACDGDGNVYVIAEHYEAEKPVEYHSKKIYEIANRLKWKRNDFNKISAIIDSAANQKTLAAEKTVSQLFLENGITCRDANKEVWTGIQRVKQYLQLREHPEKENWPKGKPKLFIFRTCTNMIKEIKSYRWAEPKEGTNAKEEPKKTNDHAMDELRYYIMTRPEPHKEPEKPVRDDLGVYKHEKEGEIDDSYIEMRVR
jgi:phage terminase large subunit-like protein